MFTVYLHTDELIIVIIPQKYFAVNLFYQLIVRAFAFSLAKAKDLSFEVVLSVLLYQQLHFIT